tara:strand:- start:160 stop:309 length:150 start_codon:yes stop_codon:yes gene_type:complete
MSNQMFRFCLRCIEVKLIKEGKCTCCNGDFILSGLTDDLHKRPKYAKSH